MKVPHVKQKQFFGVFDIVKERKRNKKSQEKISQCVFEKCKSGKGRKNKF